MPYPLIPIGGSPWIALLVTLLVVGIVVYIADWLITNVGPRLATAWVLQIIRGVIYIVAGLYVLTLLLQAFFGIQLFAGVGR